MRFSFRSFLFLVLVVVLVWVFREPILERLGVAGGTSVRQTGGETRGTPRTAEATARGRLSDLDLSVEKIAEELKATGRVVRRKAVEASRQLEESTRDTRTTAKLKARFALDPVLKTREIEIKTDDGRVSLSGRADSPEEVARAIRMAVEEDDVLEVTSTLQVEPIRHVQPTAKPVP